MLSEEVTNKLHYAIYWKRPLSEWDLKYLGAILCHILGKELKVLKKHKHMKTKIEGESKNIQFKTSIKG